MDGDFPAAHSMDTDWFAVDRDGHVALFISNENGPVPRSVPESRTNTDNVLHTDIVDLLRSLAGKPRDPEEEAVYGEGLDRDEAVRLGLFIYGHDQYSDYFLDPYSRGEMPEQPLHIDQLPPRVRAWFQEARFADVCFGAARQVQPLESMGCDVWAGGGYLGSDRVTVRPMRGFEKDYRAHCEELLKEVLAAGKLPDSLQDVRFEGLTKRLRDQLLAAQQKQRKSTDGR
jgi:hypothetical protein